MAEEKDLNPFGEVLMGLMEARGMTAADLAAMISAKPENPEITEEELLAVMTAEPGEEFNELLAVFDAGVLREN